MDCKTYIKDKLIENKMLKEVLYTEKEYNAFIVATGSNAKYSSYQRQIQKVYNILINGISENNGKNLKEENKDYVMDTLEEKSRILEARIAGINNPDELLEYYKIDMTKWKKVKQIVNKWGNYDNSNSQIKIWLELIKDPEEKKEFNYWLNLFKEKTKDYKPTYIEDNILSKKDNILPKKESIMLEIALVDHHLGQLSWHKETGYGNYDVKIARKLYLDAIKYLVNSANQFNIEQILFIIGNDFFNVNSQLNTTVRGTMQDEDCRWQKSFNYGVDLFIDAIEYLKQFAPVHVKQIPGNHDQERIYYAGAFLSAWYRDDKRVIVDNEPRSRKYYKYGRNLLGFTHGDTVKNFDRLMGLMPLEAKEYWSEVENKEWHCGHVHHETKKILILDTEATGIKVRTLSSLVLPDAWHALHGFIADRQSQAFIWHKEKGNIAEFKYRP